VRVLRLGLPDRFVDHGKRELLLDEVGLTPSAIAERVEAALVSPAAALLQGG
jgi:1-deoxy-D-xylulose-5-phosphate synthase